MDGSDDYVCLSARRALGWKELIKGFCSLASSFGWTRGSGMTWQLGLVKEALRTRSTLLGKAALAESRLTGNGSSWSLRFTHTVLGRLSLGVFVFVAVLKIFYAG